MAEITKVALKVDNNSSFPNNNAGAITPSILRAFNTNMIDSLVDEIGYTADSSSWNQQIDSLEQFTASLSTAFVSTGSFNTYTSSINSKFSDLQTTTASMENSITALNAYTASDNTAITNLNAFTASQNTKNSTLATYTASVDTKFATLGTQTGSFVTETESGSFLITASVSLNTITFTKGNNTTFAITVNTGSGGGGGDLTSLNAFTASQLTINSAIGASTSSLNTFTGSQNTKNTTLATYTASVDTKFTAVGASTSSLNTFTGSQNTKNTTLATYTASVDTKFIAVGASTSSLNTFSSSVLTQLTTLANVTSSLNTFSSSVLTQLTTLANVTSSLIAKTGSYATTGSNTFVGNQTITGNITAFSASFTYLQTIFESSSVIYSSGSNIFGDELSDTQTLSGSVKVQGSLTVNGTPVQTSSVDISALNSFTASQYVSNSFFATTGSNTFTGSQIINAGGQGDPGLTISGSINTLGNLNVYGVSNFISGSGTSIRGNSFNVQDAGGAIKFTVSNAAGIIQAQLPLQILAPFTASLQEGYAWIGGAGNISTLVATSSFAGTAIPTGTVSSSAQITAFGFVSSSVTASSLITASVNLNTITFTKGDASTFNIIVNTGSATSTDITALNSFTASQETINTAIQASTSSLNTFSASTLTRLTNIESTTASLNSSVAALNTFTASQSTASLVTSITNLNTFSASALVSISNLNSFTASQETKDTTLASVTSSLNSATASLFTSTSLSLVTASFSGNTLTFTKGDASTFGIVLPDVSGSTIDTGSFATTGSNTFTGDQTLTDASGNTVTLTDGSGSLILVAKSYTSASAHLSSSTNQVNLIFKNSDVTADTIISGSGNMFINPAAPTTGFKRYVGGSGNIALNGSNVPQISGSMAFSPTINNNYFGSNGNTLRMYGPVSSSTWTISANNVLGTINMGGSVTSTAEKLTSGLTMTGNSVGGTLTVIANQSFLTSSTTAFTNNIIAGITQVDISSSAVSLNNNIINDSGFLLTNQFYSSSVGLGILSMNRNTIGGQANRITISGSLPSGTTTGTSLSDNFIFGGSNTIRVDVANARVSGSTAYINVLRTGLMGNSLIVSGSSLLADNSSFGSVFVGRYNADDSIRNKTSDIVFAVGTGNTTTRKTGFLIDSGSNTFIEGTLNVSGATSLNGDLVITGSLTSSLQQGYVYVGDSTGKTTTVATSSFITAPTDISALNSFTSSQELLNTTFATTGSNTFVGNQIITGSVTISGSATTDLTVVGQIFVSSSATGANTAPKITVSGSTGQSRIIGTQVDTRDTEKIAKLSTSVVSIGNLTTSDEIGIAINPSASLLSPWAQGPGIYVNNDPLDTFNVVFGFQNKANYTDGRVAVLTPLSASAGFTASLQNGYAWVGNSLGQNTQVLTSSFAGTTINTGSLMVTGSVTGNVLTFTKGDTSTFTLTVATGSGGGAAFPYTGDAVITGSLGISGSMFGGVIPITVVSSTASIDFSKGNMFTLTLPSASTHIVPTNIRAGQTCNIQITQPTPGTGSVLFSPLVLFAGGNDYQATATGSAVDMLTLVSFNGTNTIAAGIKNLL